MKQSQKELTSGSRNEKIGILATILGGVLWGFSGTCGQYLFMNYDIDALCLTTIRMIAAGIILIMIGIIRQRKQMLGILQNPKDTGRLVLFSVAGLMLCQLSYMKAISYSNSGTATILQYISPVLILLVSCIMAKRMPKPKETIAICLAFAGTFILATHGNPYTMVLTKQGLSWGLFSAVTVVLYTMLPTRIMRKWGSIAVTGYGMLIGGVVLALVGKVWTMPFTIDTKGILALAAIILLGTVVAFTIYLHGVTLVGPVKGSMLSSTEPLAATICMVVWLHSGFQWVDAIGFACILSTIFILSYKKSY